MIDGRKLKNVAASPSRVTVCCETCVGARDQPDVIGKEIRSAWSCKEGWHGMAVLQSKQGSNTEAHTAASECVHYSSCCFTARRGFSRPMGNSVLWRSPSVVRWTLRPSAAWNRLRREP